ncbi:MAG: hypothetical protein ABFS30_17485, partial [Pseudomonadota bacterium]
NSRDWEGFDGLDVNCSGSHYAEEDEVWVDWSDVLYHESDSASIHYAAELDCYVFSGSAMLGSLDIDLPYSGGFPDFVEGHAGLDEFLNAAGFSDSGITYTTACIAKVKKIDHNSTDGCGRQEDPGGKERANGKCKRQNWEQGTAECPLYMHSGSGGGYFDIDID